MASSDVNLPEMDLPKSYDKLIRPATVCPSHWHYFGFPANRDGVIISRSEIVCTICNTVFKHNPKDSAPLREHLRLQHPNEQKSMELARDLAPPLIAIRSPAITVPAASSRKKLAKSSNSAPSTAKTNSNAPAKSNNNKRNAQTNNIKANVFGENEPPPLVLIKTEAPAAVAATTTASPTAPVKTEQKISPPTRRSARNAGKVSSMKYSPKDDDDDDDVRAIAMKEELIDVDAEYLLSDMDETPNQFQDDSMDDLDYVVDNDVGGGGGDSDESDTFLHRLSVKQLDKKDEVKSNASCNLTPKTKSDDNPKEYDSKENSNVPPSKRPPPLSVLKPANTVLSAITHMCLVDLQPISIVEDKGFLRLLRIINPTVVIPKIYEVCNCGNIFTLFCSD